MASIPVSGHPDESFMGPPGRKRNRGEGGKFLPKGQVMMFVGIDELADGLDAMALNGTVAGRNALNEIGMFGAAETKIRTPVDKGVLRASIGSSDADGIFELSNTRVEWGTNVEYAPWIEDGFTMATRRAVWFDDVEGFRMVNPFSYRGAHMFAQATLIVSKVVPKILGHWIEQAQKASEL